MNSEWKEGYFQRMEWYLVSMAMMVLNLVATMRYFLRPYLISCSGGI